MTAPRREELSSPAVAITPVRMSDSASRRRTLALSVNAFIREPLVSPSSPPGLCTARATHAAPGSVRRAERLRHPRRGVARGSGRLRGTEDPAVRTPRLCGGSSPKLTGSPRRPGHLGVPAPEKRRTDVHYPALRHHPSRRHAAGGDLAVRR